MPLRRVLVRCNTIEHIDTVCDRFAGKDDANRALCCQHRDVVVIHRQGGAVIALVLARADNGVIGRDGALPWRLPADMARFRALTMGRPMIMGRKTFDSLPALLPGRRHIVLTRDPGWTAAGAEPVPTAAAALAAAGNDGVVIGGAEIYALLLRYADRIDLTEIHAAPDGDTIVPPFVGWRETAREDHTAEGDRPAYSFVTLER